MRQFDLRVVEVASIGSAVRLACAGPDPGASPGQACLAWTDLPTQPFLRVPLYLHGGPDPGPTFFVPGAHPYARLAPGASLDLLGPVGRGFRLPKANGHLLAIAGSLERLLPTVETALQRGVAVTALTPRSADLLPSDVEIHRGPLTADLAAWADVVALDVTDPAARAQHIRALAPNRGQGFIQALVTPPMPCGTGACQACWVELPGSRGRRLACVDGPVFYY